jgi:DNA processing protein
LKTKSLQYQIGLTFLQGIGPKKASHLVSKLGSVEAVFTEKLKVLQQLSGYSRQFLQNMHREEAWIRAEKELDFIEKHGITTHFYLDTNYPRRLRQCDDAPILLYSKGNFDPNPSRVIAIVGTRNATDYGKSLCEELVQSIASSSIQVVSGMAYGIDICAHQLCVKNAIPTVGVLGHGLDRLYPTHHKRTADQMLSNGGLLTEFLPGTNPDRENFPMRNRIVAGMVDAVVVVESKKSGGSLITADLGNDYNRDVFAFPGNIGQPHSEGCNLLIQKSRAQLLLSGSNFLKQMNWEKSRNTRTVQRSCFVDLTNEEQAICQFLEGNSGEHVDVLSMKTSMSVSKLNVQLFHLEMKGVVRSLPGKKYALI